MKKISLGKKGIGFNTIIMALMRIITMLFGIGITKILSSQLSLTEYGTYSEAITLISLVTSITVFGLVDTEVYFYSEIKDPADRQKMINTIFLIEIILSVIGAILVLSFSSLIVKYYNNPALFSLIIIIAFEPLADNLFNLLSTLYIVEERAYVLAIRNAITSMIKFGIVCFSIFAFKSIFWVLLLTLLVNAAQLFLFYFWYKKSSFLINPFKCDKKIIKKLLLFGFSIFLVAVTNTLLKQCDKIVLGKLSNTETVAIYENASKQLPFDIIVSSIVTVTTPAISNFIISNKIDKFERLIKPFNTICLLSLLVLAFPAFLSYDELILFLYGEQYLAGNTIFIVYTVVEIVKFSNISIVLVSKNKKIELVIFMFVMLCLNVGLDVLMFYAMGPIGCAISTLIITLIIQLYLLIRTVFLTKIRVLSLMYWKRLLLVLIGCASLFVLVYFTKPLFVNYIPSTFLKLLIFYAVPFGILVLLNGKTLLSIYKELNSITIGEKDEKAVTN